VAARIIEAIPDEMMHPCWRMLPSVIGGPGGWRWFAKTRIIAAAQSIGGAISLMSRNLKEYTHHDTSDTKSKVPDIRTIPMRVRVAGAAR
jgi:hypothetical protein